MDINTSYGVIYKTTNLINGNSYIGQTIKKGEQLDKYLGSGLNIVSAIKKYGRSNFEKEILIACDSKYQLDRMERLFISLMKPDYNIAPGGQCRQTPETYRKIADKNRGRVFSEETRRRMSESAKVKIFSDEHRKHIGDAHRGNHYNLGRKTSDETKQKLSNALSGSNNPFYGKTHSDEVKKLISRLKTGNKNMVGKHLSDETKYKIAISKIGEKNHNWGKPLSDERKEKLRVSKIGKHRSEETKRKISEKLTGTKASDETRAKLSIAFSGENNPLYGKKRNEETKNKIREHLNEYYHKSGKRVICIETSIIYDYAADAERKTGIQGISKVCRGKFNTAGGYHWRYATDPD